MAKIHLYVGLGKRRGDDPLHWLLLATTPDHKTTTWYHVTGGPTRNIDYTLEIRIKRFKSQGIGEHHFIGEIDAKDQLKVKAAAQNTPPQMCQSWVVEVLRRLEKKSLVPSGTADDWASKVATLPSSGESASETSSADQDDRTPSSSSG